MVNWFSHIMFVIMLFHFNYSYFFRCHVYSIYLLYQLFQLEIPQTFGLKVRLSLRMVESEESLKEQSKYHVYVSLLRLL